MWTAIWCLQNQLILNQYIINKLLGGWPHQRQNADTARRLASWSPPDSGPSLPSSCSCPTSSRRPSPSPGRCRSPGGKREHTEPDKNVQIIQYFCFVLLWICSSLTNKSVQKLKKKISLGNNCDNRITQLWITVNLKKSAMTTNKDLDTLFNDKE